MTEGTAHKPYDFAAPLPWQEALWNRWRAALTAGSAAHALLLTGPAGLGKHRFALELAKAALCRQHDAANVPVPCGECHSCIQFDAGSHPDFISVIPGEDSNVIKVDAIRELVAELQLKSHQGGAKVAVLEPADAMNIHAANSLLKTLEEPPADTWLLLVTAWPYRLPATIRSRCQQIHFPLPETQQALDWLAGHDSGIEWQSLLRFAGGAPLTAWHYSKTDLLEKRVEFYTELFEVLQARRDPVDMAAGWEKSDLAVTVHLLAAVVMDLIRLKSYGKRALLDNSDISEKLGTVAAILDMKALFSYLERVQRGRWLLATNANPLLFLEWLLIPWSMKLECGNEMIQ